MRRDADDGFLDERSPRAGAVGRRRPFASVAVSSLALAFFLHAAPAAAHVGVLVSKASFCTPPSPIVTATDGGVTYSYTPVEADASYRLAWADGDTDPTGKFTFYYFDHELPVAVSADEVEMLGKPVVTTDGRTAANVYVSCACVAPMPATGADVCNSGLIPNCADGGARWCDNFVDWDTSQVADGVYWIAAVNNDPPYHVYNTSDAPVRVGHSANKPPAVVVAKPDGLGPGADLSYQVILLVDGDGPFTIDLAWGLDDPGKSEAPLHNIMKSIPNTVAHNGVVYYEWDVSALVNDAYFVSAEITDAHGVSSYTDSRYYVGVYHEIKVDASAGDAAPVDAAMILPAPDLSPGKTLIIPPPTGGCACAVAARGAPDAASSPSCALSLFAALVLSSLRLSRRSRRRGSRSGCTG